MRDSNPGNEVGLNNDMLTLFRVNKTIIQYCTRPLIPPPRLKTHLPVDKKYIRYETPPDKSPPLACIEMNANFQNVLKLKIACVAAGPRIRKYSLSAN